MSKSDELNGFKVFIAEYFDGCEDDYGLVSEMGGEIRWGRPFSQATSVYAEDDLIENCKDVDGLIIIARDVPTKGLFDAAPKLRIISKQGIGLDKVPLGLAADYGILVANTATTVVETVAEHTFCLILSLYRKLPPSMAAAQQCRWRVPELDFKQLRYKRVGLLGFGNIARAVARRFSGWDCVLQACDPFVDESVMKSYGAEKVAFEELLQTSDVVSMHMPLLDSTKEIMDEKAFSLMKPGSFFVNTSRGKLVNEPALIKALKDKKLAGAGLDVLYEEPVTPDNALLNFDNVYLTPHSAGTAYESMVLTAKQSALNVVNALLGKVPDFLANPQGLSKWEARFVK